MLRRLCWSVPTGFHASPFAVSPSLLTPCSGTACTIFGIWDDTSEARSLYFLALIYITVRLATMILPYLFFHLPPAGHGAEDRLRFRCGGSEREKRARLYWPNLSHVPTPGS